MGLIELLTLIKGVLEFPTEVRLLLDALRNANKAANRAEFQANLQKAVDEINKDLDPRSLVNLIHGGL